MLIFRPNKHPKPVITVASIWLEFEASAKRFFAESKLLTKSKHLFNFKRDDFVKLASFISSELPLSHINIAYCISSNMYLQMPLET